MSWQASPGFDPEKCAISIRQKGNTASGMAAMAAQPNAFVSLVKYQI